MRYFGRVFRPPSEAYSLIVQATVGCSHNRCAFCEMYKEKKFFIRPLEDVLEDFRMARAAYREIDRIFIADGDALILKTDYLLEILRYIRTSIPECSRVSLYASPKSVRFKTDEELETLQKAGLSMAYMGLESGSDSILKMMDKGNSHDEIVTAGKRLRKAGIRLSVTAISGLGGKEHWQEHALETARAFSEMKPEYIALLTLLIEEGTPLHTWVRQGSFHTLNPLEVMEETRLMLQHLDSEGSIFRANHASNYVQLKGTLNCDRDALCALLDDALHGKVHLKDERFRAL